MTGPTAHLICGATGAGKSTYALELARKIKAPIFSIDDWMATLFGPDVGEVPDWPWIAGRVTRCETQIVKSARDLGACGMSSILDISLLRAERRREIAAELRASGLGLRLHVLDVCADERWRRVTQRNAARGETYRVAVTRTMFDFIETIWQPPSATECAAMNDGAA